MEIWKQITDSTYEVSDLGNVRHLGFNLAQAISPTGYCQVSIKIGGVVGRKRIGKRRSFLVHRLVAEAFLGPCPEGLEVNHKDRNRQNNVLTNLEYTTRLENMRHAAEKPSRNSGRKAWNDGLTAETDPRVAAQGWEKGEQRGKPAWNDGLTKETDPRIKPSWNDGLTKKDNPELNFGGWEKGKPRGPGQKGRVVSEETKQRQREAALARHAKLSEEERKALTEAANEACRGKENVNKGKQIHSEESRKDISDAVKQYREENRHAGN